MPDVALTDAVKAMALELGADLVGVAPSARYKNAPLMMSPEGHLPGARCVFVIGIHHPDAAVELGGEENGENQPHQPFHRENPSLTQDPGKPGSRPQNQGRYANSDSEGQNPLREPGWSP